ncbi:thioredoxin family protein [Flavobacterium sp. xlx-214]|uniref:protein-disulfide reductase DsbD family protein n=1 Tax=unclassified Flavobacterium TaxID=196869 RepID=UPI0013D044E4|nr:MULTISPECIES: thioredoxin family protein [unclassified Flavobacterium]MBA5791623.1 thioredoxin family protein [Flavobacterium sp. xlx-221]QMI82868.1 thioredoxin family protein [Flavobacterium sp. xlx-214]
MRNFLTFLVLLIASIGFSQVQDPVKWKSSIQKISDTEYQIKLDATIEGEWHMYSQFTPDGGPLPLEFIYNNAEGNFEPQGKAKESEYTKKFNDVFGVDEYYFAKQASFTHNIKITNANVKNIQLEVFYQACIDMCINQNKYFVFDLATVTSKEVQNFEDVAAVGSDVKTDSLAKTAPIADAKKVDKTEQKGLLSIFIIAFFSGFAALLTPCVFPMIPMTVSFFTKQSKSKAKGIKNAIIYGLSIIIIYVLLGFIVTKIFGADALNALSTNVWFNIIFFVILIVFASSFLGAFEIMLPNSWANKVDKQADRGGFLGIFFMALALAIVSFSCTGPIVGTLLVEAASKGGLAPLIGMFGFSLALALPFMLFAMFPGWLNSMPRSGGWMNTVKVSLGFLELALAFKFLSNADLVLQKHWLQREIFLAIWITIFAAWAIYLFGKIQLPHDSKIDKISVGRLFMALLVSTFTIYLVPGLWGAPLKLISGFPPPMTYAESPNGIGGGTVVASTTDIPDGAKSGPHGIVAFLDYEKGMAYAKENNKPVLLDFTGFACVNCRKMEDYVWSETQILNILQNDVVLISLYVDDKKELPEAEQYVSKTTGKKIKTIGNKWSDFQIEKYQANAQPYYIVLDNEGNSLNTPVGYTPEVSEYETWLKEGITKYSK